MAEARWGEGDDELSFGGDWEEDPFPGEDPARARHVPTHQICLPMACEMFCSGSLHVVLLRLWMEQERLGPMFWTGTQPCERGVLSPEF